MGIYKEQVFRLLFVYQYKCLCSFFALRYNEEKKSKGRIIVSHFQYYILFMKMVHMAAFLLVVVGAVVWGLIGAVGYDVFSLLGGQDAGISKIVMILVGLSGVYLLVTHKKECHSCSA